MKKIRNHGKTYFYRNLKEFKIFSRHKTQKNIKIQKKLLEKFKKLEKIKIFEKMVKSIIYTFIAILESSHFFAIFLR